MTLIEKLGGRKLVACLVVLIVSVAAFIVKGDISANLADMLKYLITTYIAGNVGTDLVSSLTAKKADEAIPSVTITDVEHTVAKAVGETYQVSPQYVSDSVKALDEAVGSKFSEIEHAIGNLALSVQGIQNSVQYVMERVPPKAAPQQPAFVAPMGQQQTFSTPPRRIEEPRPMVDFSQPVSFNPNPGMVNMMNPFNNIPPLSTIDPNLITNQNPLG